MGKARERTHNEGFRFKRRPEMLPTEAIHRIWVLTERNLGSKAIAKAMGISRNTVRKYQSHFRAKKPIPSRVQRPSQLDAFRDQIHKWFLACRGHCPVMLRKIRSELGVTISLRQLQKYCRPWRVQELAGTEMTERYEVPPGNEMQIDFGFDDILIAGVKTRVCVFVAVLSYSRRVFAKLYPTENQSAWLDGIECAFRYFNGVPVAVVSDNTRCLVDGKAELGKTIFNRRYLQLSRYWQFIPVNCRPYRAKTKGKVERMVGYVKTSCLSGLEADDLQEAQEQVNAWMRTVADRRRIDGLDGRPIDRYQTEATALRPYMGPHLSQLRLETRKIDISGRIQVDGVQYPISGTDAGTAVDVFIEEETIAVFLHGQCIAKLNRTADAYQASTFKHQQKQSWEINGMQSSGLSRSLKEYDRFIEENSYGRC